MKKTLLYIILFLSGIAIGSLLFMDNGFLSKDAKLSKYSYLASYAPSEDRKQDFVQSASSMLGEVLIVSGSIQEVYKNKNDQLVIYLKDQNIPLPINCTFNLADIQLVEPFKLGETINLQGVFNQLDEEIFLASCRIINRGN
ncbi:MAG: hypothetical protein P1P88_19670 [Bacteroidales bacterium]|nr:hypothetical protein [Bacteroidales bacterium]